MNNLKENKIKVKLLAGFTMIEMLVVISIIGILASLALISFTGSQRQARDTNRKSDLKQYQNALEAYANLTSGLYPSRTTVSSLYSTVCSDLNSVINPDITCSQDPKTLVDGSYYDYKYISDGTGSGTTTATNYVIWARAENSASAKYFVFCSNGKVGEVTTIPSSSSCPI